MKSPVTADLIDAVTTIAVEDIRERLAELAAEQKALRTLLNAARARDRARQRLSPAERSANAKKSS